MATWIELILICQMFAFFRYPLLKYFNIFNRSHIGLEIFLPSDILSILLTDIASEIPIWNRSIELTYFSLLFSLRHYFTKNLKWSFLPDLCYSRRSLCINLTTHLTVNRSKYPVWFMRSPSKGRTFYQSLSCSCFLFCCEQL